MRTEHHVSSYQSILTGIKKGIHWWVEGLRLLLPLRIRTFLSLRQHRYSLSLDGTVLVLENQNALEGTASHYFDLSQPQQSQELEDEFKVLNSQKTHLTLSLAANWGLCRTLKFPIQASSSLDGILHYELEKVTPFKPEQIIYAYTILHRDKNTNTIEIEFHATPKNKLLPILSQIEQLGLHPDKVVLQHPDAQKEINLLPDTNNPSNQTSRWHYVNLTLVICSLILFLIYKGVPLYHLEKEIKMTEEELKPLRKEAKIADSLKAEWNRLKNQNAAVNQQITAYQPILLILDEMTDILPNTTWLSDLNIEKDQIQLRGESTSASALIPLIEGSDLFRNTRFRSPVMTQSSGKETFEIITYRQEATRSTQVLP